jgi:hypothetical protein
MVKPRVFISSTYYDLKHLRSSLDSFIESLGFDPILSEKGDIAFTPDTTLDESCYREAANADIFVLIIGGRYGTEASGKEKKPTRSFFEKYESITKKEFESALSRDIPVYVLVDANVYSEYQTYLRNKERKDVNYAHVDSVNIFAFIEVILAKPRNNPVHPFEKFSEIETWLREQWAGLFRELLQRSNQEQQLATLSSQISELQEVNVTLKRYLEAVMGGISKNDSAELIESERKRLEELEKREKIMANRWYPYVNHRIPLSIEDFINIVSKSKSFADFAHELSRNDKQEEKVFNNDLIEYSKARRDLNAIREILGLKPFKMINKKAITTHDK